MSLNGLNSSVFTYSLNGLQTISSNGGQLLPVVAGSNINVVNDGVEYIVNLNNNINVNSIVATTGTITTLTSTNETVTNLTSTNFTGTNAAITNETVVNLTGTNASFTNATIGNLTISSVNIPNLTFNQATGGNLSLTGTITSLNDKTTYLTYSIATGTTNYTTNTSATNYYNNANSNPLLYSINNDTTLSANNGTIYLRPVAYNNAATQVSVNNLGRISAPYMTVGDEISNNISNSQNITTATLQVSGAMTGSTIATSSTINAGGILSTTSGSIKNGNSTWTTNSNDIFLNANTDTIYLRPKGLTASPADAQVYLQTNGNLVCSTGTLTAFNGTFSGGLNAVNANINSYALTAGGFVYSPLFTGTNYYGTNFYGGTFNGSTKGNVSVTNPQKMYFYESDGTTECMRIEPAAVTNVLSWYCAPYGSQLQFFMRSQASGGYFSCNQVALTDYVYAPNAQHDNFYTTRSDGLQTNSMYFINSTSLQSRPFIFQNLNQSSYVKAYGSAGYNNGFAIGDTTAERWFIYNKANTSTLAINNNSSDLVTLSSTLMNITPEVKVQNAFNVGAPNFGNNALINLGYTGTLNGSLNTRMGYIYHDSNRIYINNQQYNNSRLQSSTIGGICFQPANGVYATYIDPNGKTTIYCDSYTDSSMTLLNYSTGGYGLYIRSPNDSAVNNYYKLVVEGTNYTPAFAVHPTVSSVTSNITLGRLNYPNSTEAITIRPYATSNQPQYIRICNSYLDNVANGVMHLGLWGTGSAGIQADVFINNYSDNSGGKKSGIRFQTDTNNYGTTCTAQYIDFTGQTFFNPYTQRGLGAGNTRATAVLSVNYDFYQLPAVGTTFSTSRGNGAFIPRVLVTLNNQSYTVAAGNTKLVGANGTNVNHSPYQVGASGHQTYSIRADWSGIYQVSANINLFCTTSTVFYVYLYHGATINDQLSVGSIPSGQFTNYCLSKWINVTAGDDIWMTIQADSQTLTVGNNSTWEISYQG